MVDHLPDEYKAGVRRKMQNAYAMAEYADAKRALDQLHRELMDLNPSAARSLEEGLELSPSDPIIKTYLKDPQHLKAQDITHELGLKGPFQTLLDKAAKKRGWTLVRG